MSELTVILDRKEMVARMEAKTIRIDRPGCRPERIPLNMVTSFIVIGSPMVSCDVWRALAKQNISAVLLPTRGGGETAYMGAGLSATIKTRLAQHHAFHDNKCSLTISRWLLQQKMKGQENVIQKFKNNGPENFYNQIEKCRIELQKADTRNSIMGHEGTAARLYFNALGNILPSKWKFFGRNRRPPRDPVNALLSLGYVMAGGEVRQAVQKRGLDPAIGFLHSPQSGRESLVLDILEPIRPEVDWFALQLLDTLTLRDFTTNQQDGCLLNKNGRKIFFKNWAQWKSSSEDKKSLRKMANKIINELIGIFPNTEN